MIRALLANAAAPLLIYAALRWGGVNDLVALAAGAVAPLFWGLVVAVRRRRADPFSVLALAGLGVAVVLSLATGGGALPLLLRHAVVTGVGGVACLVSVLLGRPLLAFLRPLLIRFAPPGRLPARTTWRPSGADRRRYFTVLTTLLGVVLLAHAAANLVLALTLTTGEYLLVSRPVSWAITGAGALLALWYVRRARRGRA